MSIYMDLMSSDYIELAKKFRVNPEHCDNPEHYQKYIWQDSITDQKQGMGVTHVLIDENELTQEKKMAGYITLRSSSLIMDSEGSCKLGYPALEISELAVDCDYEGRNLGTDMVKFAINQAHELNETTMGIQYVILCADPQAEGFYSNKNVGFKTIPTYQQIPRENRNQNCTPMYFKVASY